MPQPLPAVRRRRWVRSRPTTGSLVAGQPHVAAVWFPANDHPRDKARFQFAVTVPDRPRGRGQRRPGQPRATPASPTWVWDAPAPMAPVPGHRRHRRVRPDRVPATLGGRPGGIDHVDAVDTDLLTPVTPHTGTRYALSQAAPEAPRYKRLRRTIAVPGGGRRPSPSGSTGTPRPTRTSSPSRPAPRPDRLHDAAGHQRPHLGPTPATPCPYWLGLHPFLTPLPDRHGGGGCTPAGTTGVVERAPPAAATAGSSGRSTSATSPASTAEVVDQLRQRRHRPGPPASPSTTSRCRPARARRRSRPTVTSWTAGPVPGPPAGSDTNANDWITGTVRRRSDPRASSAQTSLARQPEILELPVHPVRAVPVRGRRRHRRRLHRPRLRPGEPDPAHLSAGDLRRPAARRERRSSTSWPTSGTATGSRSAAGSTSG